MEVNEKHEDSYILWRIGNLGGCKEATASASWSVLPEAPAPRLDVVASRPNIVLGSSAWTFAAETRLHNFHHYQFSQMHFPTATETKIQFIRLL